VESKAFHICPFCRAPSPVCELRCKGCGRSLVGLPLAVYGSEVDAVVAQPLRPASAARRRPGPPAMRRPPREPRPGAIVGMAAALVLTIGAGATLVRPRRPAPAVPASAAREVPAPQASARVAGPRKSIAPPAARRRPEIYALHPDIRPARASVGEDEVTEPGEDALVLRAQLRRAEEGRDRLADRVDRLRARMNVPVITDVDRYQRMQDELETAREDLDRAEADVARWRRAVRRVG
jgi:hypothetical protein